MGVSRRKPNEAGAVTWNFECGEDLVKGSPVYIYSDAGTAKVKKVFTSLGNIGDFGYTYYNDSCLIYDDKIVVVYRDSANGSKGSVRCGVINPDKSVTWGNPVIFWNSYAYYMSICKVDDNCFAIVARGTGNKTAAWIGTVSGTTIGLGTEHPLSSGYGYDNACCQLVAGRFIAGWRDASMMNRIMTRIGSVVGFNIVWGTVVQVTISTAYDTALALVDTDKFAITYRRSDGSSRGMCRASLFSGDIITGYGTEVRYTDGYALYNKICSPDNDKIAVIWRDNSDGNKPKAVVGSFTGTTPVFDQGEIITLNDESTYQPDICALSAGEVICAFSDDLTPYRGLISVCSLSGTILTQAAPQCFYNGRNYYMTLCTINSAKYFLVWYAASETKTYYLAIDGDLNMLDWTMGLMQESGLLGETKPIDLIGGISEQLSGMTPGELEYIQCDATISNVKSDYPIGISLASDKMLIHKSPLG